MMARQLLFGVFTVLVICSLAQAADYSLRCKSLDERVSKSVANINDRDEVFKEGSKTKEAGHELVTIWKNVHEQKQCDEYTMRQLRAVSQCDPRKFKHLITLNQEGIEFLDKCFPTKYWTKKLNHAEAKLDVDVREGLSVFFSEDFKSKYNKEDKSGATATLTRFGGDCCEPMKAAATTADSFVKLLAHQKQASLSDMVTLLKRSTDAITHNLKEFLIPLCTKYVAQTFDLMDDAIYMANLKPNFLDTMTPRFQEAVFRFQFCSKITDGKESSLADLIKDKI